MKTVAFVLLLIITTALAKKESPRRGITNGPPTLKCNDYADVLSPTRLVLLGLAMILLGLKQSPLMQMGFKDSGKWSSFFYNTNIITFIFNLLSK